MAIHPDRRKAFALREQLILDTARELLQREGLLTLQMSRLARACGLAVGTLYLHFDTKEDLLLALATGNAESRLDLFARAAAWNGPSRERMLAVAIADTLALEQAPELFRLQQYVLTEVVWNAASARQRQRMHEASAPIQALLEGIVARAVADGDLPDTHGMAAGELVLGAWCQCLGLHTLAHAEGLLASHDLRQPYRLLFKQLNLLLNGYGWLPLMAPVDDATVAAQVERLCRHVFDLPLTFCAAHARRLAPESRLATEPSP